MHRTLNILTPNPPTNLSTRILTSLKSRTDSGRIRSLPTPLFNPSSSSTDEIKPLIDFSSNDYLGVAHSNSLKVKSLDSGCDSCACSNGGSTGSRLLSGNSRVHMECEGYLQDVHRPSLLSTLSTSTPTFSSSESSSNRVKYNRALLFNSGYDANLSVMSTMVNEGDVVIMDELCHNSLITGIKLSRITDRSNDVINFKHNCVVSLSEVIERRIVKSLESGNAVNNVFIVIESVYSMDGTIAPIDTILSIASGMEGKYGVGVYVIVDEAHGTGVYGASNRRDMKVFRHHANSTIAYTSQALLQANLYAEVTLTGGAGVISAMGLQDHPNLLCAVHTFGKGVASHGAVVIAHDGITRHLTGDSEGRGDDGEDTYRYIDGENFTIKETQISSQSSQPTASPSQTQTQTRPHPLISYLLNYAQPLIYSTALPQSSVMHITKSYHLLTSSSGELRRKNLFENVSHFRKLCAQLNLPIMTQHGRGVGPIQAFRTSDGNAGCIALANHIKSRGYGVYPIRAPTVKEERIRVILHAHNEREEVEGLCVAVREFMDIDSYGEKERSEKVGKATV